ncbi:uncharacterized protein V1516DRAFT_675729 [Lipomyces oligophaga]|uniref:uncharacterized protein n=1 Tax=Lipomyces oligophaga TaxID=45792 RepID=UPI0034CE198D
MSINRQAKARHHRIPHNFDETGLHVDELQTVPAAPISTDNPDSDSNEQASENGTLEHSTHEEVLAIPKDVPMFTVDPHNPGAVLRHYLLRIQKYSSYTFCGFLALHYSAVMLAPAVTRAIGPNDSATSLLLFGRAIYQASPAIETGLVAGSMVVHVLSGVIIRISRLRRDRRWYKTPLRELFSSSRSKSPTPLPSSSSSSATTFSRISQTGWLLVPFVSLHAYLARYVPLKIEGDSSSIDLRYITYGFSKTPYLSSIGYFAMILFTTHHVTYGLAKWLRISKKNMKYVRSLSGLALVVALLGVHVVSRSSSTGAVLEPWLRAKYDILYEYSIKSIL